MKRIIGRALMLLGIAMVLLAAVIAINNQRESRFAQTASRHVLAEIEESTTQTFNAVEESSGQLAAAEHPTTGILSEALTAKTVDGFDYIGTLSIPDLDLTLPVMEQWSYEGLRIAPGRFSGSPYTGDFTVCAHNYPGHFGKLSTLSSGAEIRFTDFNGVVWVYRLLCQEILQPNALEQMTGTDGDKDWDLTLFTCTPGGQTRAAYRFTLAQMLPG